MDKNEQVRYQDIEEAAVRMGNLAGALIATAISAFNKARDAFNNQRKGANR
jgi:hypothetical protein